MRNACHTLELMRFLTTLLLLAFLSACGPKTMQARMKDAERYADKASSELDEAEKAATALEPKKMEDALKDAKEWLDEKDIELYPEAQMHIDRYKELQARVPQVKAEREKRDLEIRLNKARDRIVPRVQAMLEAQEALSPNAPTKQQCEAVEDKAKLVKEAVDDDQDLFTKDADFAMWAKSQRNKVDKALEAVARSRKALAFLDGPAKAYGEAVAAQKEAKAKKDPADQEKLLTDAKNKLGVCSKDGKTFDAEKATSSVGFTIDGKAQTPAQLVTLCDKVLKVVEVDLKKASTAAAAAAKAAKAKADKEEKLAKEKAAKEEKLAKEKAAKEAAAKKAQEAKEAAAKKAREAKEAKEKAAKEAAAKKAAAKKK